MKQGLQSIIVIIMIKIFDINLTMIKIKYNEYQKKSSVAITESTVCRSVSQSVGGSVGRSVSQSVSQRVVSRLVGLSVNR